MPNVIDVFRTEFVHYMPEGHVFEEGVLYVSEAFGCTIHLCPCGCGEKIHVPFDDGTHWWTYTRVDDKVTLSPSIGNWQILCRSHYYIEANRVKWA